MENTKSYCERLYFDVYQTKSNTTYITVIYYIGEVILWINEVKYYNKRSHLV